MSYLSPLIHGNIEKKITFKVKIMKTFIEGIVEKRVDVLLQEIEKISEVYIECQKRETNSIIEITTLLAMPKHLERRIAVISMQLTILNLLFKTKDK